MLVQLGLLMGVFGTVTVLVDRSTAKIWISSHETASIDQSRAIPDSLVAQVRSQADVDGSATLSVRDADWHASSGKRLVVSVIGIDPLNDALSCPQYPAADWCAALADPMSVVVDEADLSKLGIRVGDSAQINGERVHVIAAGSGLRSIGSALVFSSAQTARRLAPSTSAQTTFVLAHLTANADLAHVQKHLQALLHRAAYRVWTRDELSATSQRYWLLESGVGTGFLFSTLLGLLIGVVITSQTLRAAVLGNVREYAAFRAMGVPAHKLSGVIVEQSLWIAAAGVTMTLLVSGLVRLLTSVWHVPFVLTPSSMFAAAAIGLVTAVGSGLFALRELYRLEPAELLR